MDLQNNNARAQREAIEAFEKKMREHNVEISTLKNQVQTLTNLVGEIQQSNNLALAKLRGSGSTG